MEEKTKKKPQQKKKTKVNESINRDNCVFKEAIERYISLLNSQMDSSPIIINTLAANVKASANNFNKFLKENSHYCPVKVDKAFFEIIEIQSTIAIFKGATI